MTPERQALWAMSFGDLIEEVERLQAENTALKVKAEEMKAALQIVSVGIWRNIKNNTCGLSGAAAAVHAVEAALKAQVTKEIE